jgi:hypothetical protein
MERATRTRTGEGPGCNAGLPSASQVFWREEMTGERVADGALVMGTTPSRSRVQMRLTLAAIKVNRCHMILVICGPE